MVGWLILLAPLLSAAIITAWVRPNRILSPLISIGACGLAFLVAVGFFTGSVQAPAPYVWSDFPGLTLQIGLQIDNLSKVMLLVVTGVGFLIHVFSWGYMDEDPGKSRFFAKLSLFMFSMIGIVVATNFVQMFIFWELVGLSSYLLIGFWFGKDSAAAAANKAFLANRVGDFGFMIGILLFWALTGSVMFDPGLADKLTASPLLAVTALLLFCGCVGKSAQLPLHTWLPDAMEGPTPVSALIHAATMVAAGVYMLCRIYPIVLQSSPFALEVIAFVGGITSIFAALCAVQQNDIKRILAYSTLSQLGYMVMAVGCGGPVSAMFHLTTHACFKAMLFLGAGSVIHSLHHEQDIWKMGGLWKKMPVTFWTFLLGTLALCGCPPFAGFWSKDQIIAVAFAKMPALGIIGLITAFLTTFYMLRLVFVAFLGKPRDHGVDHAHESPAVMILPLIILAIPTVFIGLPALHVTSLLQPDFEAPESSFVLTGSIIALAAGAFLAFSLYGRATKDPLSLPLLAHKFYVDEIYDATILALQNALARFMGWVDEWLIGCVLVRGSSVTASCLGEVLRCVQAGNLRGYAFFFGLGAALLLYWILK